jgi:CheY-like chemotaxis protein
MTDNKVSILLVDRDADRTESLAARLDQPGFLVTSTHNGMEARARLKSESFDGLVIDVLMTRTGHLDLISWTRFRQPSMVIVVTSDLQAPAIEREVLDRGANVVVTKLVAPDRLAACFAGCTNGCYPLTQADHDREGHPNMIEHLDAMMRSGRKTVLEVIANNRRHGRIFVSDGRVLHAVYGPCLGEEALYRCLSAADGQLLALPWREPARVTITKTRECLLMEAARYRDERLRVE